MSSALITRALIAATLALVTLVLGVVLATEEQWIILVAAGFVALLVAIGERSAHALKAASEFTSESSRACMMLVIAGLVLAASMADQHFPSLMLATVLVWGLLSLGLTLQFGFAGVVNFAGAAFFGVGGYTAAVLGNAWPAVPGLLVLIVSGLTAVVVGSVLIAPLLRTEGHYAALVTIAFGILFATFLEVNEALGGPQGMFVAPLKILGFDLSSSLTIGDIETSYYFNYAIVALLLFALALFFVLRLESSWIGLNFDMIRTDETAAAAFGINVARWRVSSFLLGNFLIGIAGGLYAAMTGFVAPTNFTFEDSLMMVAIIILGGIGNPWGVLPASALLILLPEKLQAIAEYRFLLFAILVVLVLRFRPDGLFPRALRLYNRKEAG